MLTGIRCGIGFFLLAAIVGIVPFVHGQKGSSTEIDSGHSLKVDSSGCTRSPSFIQLDLSTPGQTLQNVGTDSVQRQQKNTVPSATHGFLKVILKALIHIFTFWLTKDSEISG